MRKEKDHNTVSNTKITLSYKNITTIGYDLPRMLLGVTRLYLSNNKITSLNGIETMQNLTHFSISFNNIERIEELGKIYNKNLLVSLSVKGNLFCKNPLSNIILINQFKKLKDLDGFKISEATYKVMEDSKGIRCDIIPFLYIVEENLDKIRKLIHTLLINIEIETKFNNTVFTEEKMKNIVYLMNIIGILNCHPDLVNKYLVCII